MENEIVQTKVNERFIKFDFNKRKRMPSGCQTEFYAQNKRKSSCPVSNEVLKSPLNKEAKNSSSQYPGYTYFRSLFSSRDISIPQNVDYNSFQESQESYMHSQRIESYSPASEYILPLGKMNKNNNINYQLQEEKLIRCQILNLQEPQKEPWTQDDDLNLLKCALRFGRRWRQIQLEWKMVIKRTQKQMRQRLKVLMEKEKKCFTPTHCQPISLREISKIQDSGYESDTSSCSSLVDVQLSSEDKKKINELIKDIQESRNYPNHRNSMFSEKDELSLNVQKKKLRNFVQHDLQMSQRNIIISRETESLEKLSSIEVKSQMMEQNDIAKDVEALDQTCSQSLKNTPLLMSTLSMNLQQMNIAPSRSNLPTVTLKVEPPEFLIMSDLQDLQFSVVNYRTGVIHFLSPEQIMKILEQSHQKNIQQESQGHYQQ